MKLWVSGWRKLTDYKWFCECMKEAITMWGDETPVCVISGGAKGADLMAERWAAERSIPVVRHTHSGGEPMARLTDQRESDAMEPWRMSAHTSLHSPTTAKAKGRRMPFAERNARIFQNVSLT